VKHARYDWLLFAESHLTKRLFGSIQSQKGAEGCLTKPWGGRGQQFGARVGTDGTVVPNLGPSQRKSDALDSLAGYIVWA
jgi:hypothetical protein